MNGSRDYTTHRKWKMYINIIIVQLYLEKLKLLKRVEQNIKNLKSHDSMLIIYTPHGKHIAGFWGVFFVQNILMSAKDTFQRQR